MKSIQELNPSGRRVILRVDWNVTLGKALQVVDETRIKRTIPTILWLLEHGAKQVVIMSHLGKAGEGKSLKEIGEYASRLMGKKIIFCQAVTECYSVKHELVLLENLRTWEGEDKNDPEFARQLASLGEVYVNEAFGEAHRESASIVGIPKLIPGYAGLNFVKEVETLTKVQDEPARPLVVVMGGAKVEDKLQLLEVMSQKAQMILLGGKLANEFVKRKIKLGGKAKVVVPVEGSDLLDIGEETRRLFTAEIVKAGTVVWNGPMGKVEEEKYQAGTHAIFEAIVANEQAYTVVGGGDTLAAIKQEKHLERIDFISTGGGAMLKLLETGTLPGIEALA